MKTCISLLMIVTCAFFLVACGNTATATETAQNPTTYTSLSSETKLAIGTLKLDGSEQDITASQAVELLSLWQAYQALNNSETAAQAELDAVAKQIQATLTDEQTQAIESFVITADTMNEVMQSAMPEISAPTDTAESSASASSGGPGGPMDDGTPPDGGMMSGDPAMAGVEMQATPDASNPMTSTQTIHPMLLKGLIQMLETKAQAAAQ